MIKMIGIAVAVYFLMVAALYLAQRSLIYLPDRSRPDPAASGAPEMAVVELTTDDGLELVAWWRPPVSAAAPVMILFHGNAGHIGHRSHKIRPYLDRGWGVLLTTWRGYSGNPGTPTEDGLVADGRAALAFLAHQGISTRRTVFYGESLGGGVAIALAADATRAFVPAAIVLEAAFTSIPDVAASRFPIFPVRLLIRDRFDTLSRIGHVQAPILVIHGERDRVIPVAQGRRLLAAANAPKTGHFIPGAGHNDLAAFGLAERVIEFVEQYFQPEGN